MRMMASCKLFLATICLFQLTRAFIIGGSLNTNLDGRQNAPARSEGDWNPTTNDLQRLLYHYRDMVGHARWERLVAQTLERRGRATSLSEFDGQQTSRRRLRSRRSIEINEASHNIVTAPETLQVIDISSLAGQSESLSLPVEGEASSRICSVPARLPQMVRNLNGFLTDKQYLGLVPIASERITIPADQPADQCPSPTGDWWGQRVEINLRSTCPWIITERDNGMDAYPRFVPEAKCLCENCINAGSYSCKYQTQELTILRHKGCKDGVALLEKDVVHVNVGCFCAAPLPASSARETLSPRASIPQPIRA